MSFLTGLAAQVVQWLLTKLGGFVVALIQKMNRRKEIQEQANTSVEPLIKAQTPEEIRKATDDALRKF